ncbi:MAG: hypothetical protein ACJLS3_13655 [Erythrobacter sp.]
MTLNRRGIWHPGVLVLLAGSLAQPALAEPAQPPADAPIKEGEIIYSREVRHSIGAPHYPGRAHAAVTAPTNTIIRSVNIGLAPLSDSENAAVTGSLRQLAGVTTQLDLQLLGAGAGAGPQGSDALAGSQNAAASTGGVIGQAMGALSSALGSLSALTGGRP